MEKIILDDGIRKIVDIGIKNAYGKKCYISTFLGEFSGCIAKNREYSKRKKYLESVGALKVMPQKYLDVIDFDLKAINKMKKYIDIPEYYIESKWNVFES